jgi:hypothetical protein
MTQEKTSPPEIMLSLSGRELLRKPEIFQTKKNIKNLVSCPIRIYKKLYSKTLRNVAEFCQAMAYSENEFNTTYGFLIRQLSLAETALKLRRGVLLPKNAGAESIAAEEAQWTYAVFAASLVRNLYQLQTNREVSRYLLQGNYINRWSPMTESLYKKTFYYSMEFTPNNSAVSNDIFMAAISEHVFPILAVNWLCTNKDLFKQWWDCVLHQPSDLNDIEPIIQLAGKKAGIIL